MNETIEALVARAYEQSLKTCELCAAPTQLGCTNDRGGRVKVLCESCRKMHCPPPRQQDKSVLPVWMQEHDGKL